MPRKGGGAVFKLPGWRVALSYYPNGVFSIISNKSLNMTSGCSMKKTEPFKIYLPPENEHLILFHYSNVIL